MDKEHEKMIETLAHRTETTGQLLAWRAAVRSELFYSYSDDWSTDSAPNAKDFPGVILWDEVAGPWHEFVLQRKDVIIRITHTRRQVNSYVFAPSLERARAEVKELRGLIPSALRKVKLIDVTFWYHTHHGPRSYDRQLEAPTWAEVEANYPSETREKLRNLQHVEPSEGSGKLVLWQGDPGTGKTFALRALAEEWAEWCRVHYVLDPENFFREGDYLLSVILGQDEISASADTRPAWRLIVLEDAGELLAKDARAQVGQGLSRLLNLCDGLLGQGLRIMVLITTNEEVKVLHDAVSRPGRCLAQVNFEKFHMAGANDWLAAHGAGMRVARPSTLADLYALAHGGQVPERAVAGFK